MNEQMNWITGRSTLPVRLKKMKQIVKGQSHLDVKRHSALIILTFSRVKSTVARSNNSV